MNHSFKSIPFVLVSVLLLIGCQEDAPVKEIIRPVKALKVADIDTFENEKFNGIAKATQEVDLSFRVDGPLITRPVKVGDEVMVKVIEIDRMGRVNLSRRAVFQDAAGGEGGQPRPATQSHRDRPQRPGGFRGDRPRRDQPRNPSRKPSR